MSWVNITLGAVLVLLGSSFGVVALAWARGENLSPDQEAYADLLPIAGMAVASVIVFGGVRLIVAGLGS